MKVLPFWQEFGIILAGTGILFVLFLWIAARIQKRR